MYEQDNYLAHFGVLGMKWGVRKYQNSDGSLTSKGKKRYAELDDGSQVKLSMRSRVLRNRAEKQQKASDSWNLSEQGNAELKKLGFTDKDIADLANQSKKTAQTAKERFDRSVKVDQITQHYRTQISAGERFKQSMKYGAYAEQVYVTEKLFKEQYGYDIQRGRAAANTMLTGSLITNTNSAIRKYIRGQKMAN